MVKKILLMGVSTSGDNYDIPYVFGNVTEKVTEPYEIIPFSDAVNTFGEDPSDLAAAYSTVADNPEQNLHLRSITKTLNQINQLCAVSKEINSGEIEVHCVRITTGKRAILKLTDNSPSAIPGKYSAKTGQNTMIIESLKRGDEYNYFNVSISSGARPVVTLTYDKPAETESIKIIQGDLLNLPFTATMSTNSVYEVANAINNSPFGAYIQARVPTYTHMQTYPATRYLRLPDSETSYRIAEMQYLTGVFTEAFTLNKQKQSHTFSYTPRYIEEILVTYTRDVWVDTNETSVYILDKVAFVDGAKISVIDDPDSIVMGIGYPRIDIQPNSMGKKFTVQVKIRAQELSSVNSNPGSVYVLGNNSIAFPNLDLEITTLDISIKYFYDIRSNYIPNMGYEGKGSVTDLSDWDNRVEKAFTYGYNPIFWLEQYTPEFIVELKAAWLEKKPLAAFKPMYLEFLNEIICSTDFMSLGMVSNDVIDSLIADIGYNTWTCREINCQLIQANFPEFSVNYALSAKPPLINLSSYKNLTGVIINHEYHLNNGTVNSYLATGEDNYRMTHDEYFRAIKNTIVEQNLSSYILDRFIDDVIILGGYIDNADLVLNTKTHRYNISTGTIFQDAVGYYYYINDVNFLDQKLSSIVYTGAPEIDGRISVNGHILRFDAPVITGDPTTDFEAAYGRDILPVDIHIDFTYHDKNNTPYDKIASGMFGNTIVPDSVMVRDIMGMEFKFSTKPFFHMAATDVKKEFDTYCHNIFRQITTLQKLTHANITMGDAMMETPQNGTDSLSFIEPAVLSCITEFVCMKKRQGKLGDNWTEYFKDLISTQHEQLLGRDFVLRAEERGLEIFTNSGLDQNTVCVSATNLHTHAVLRFNKYKQYHRMIMKIYQSTWINFQGQIAAGPEEFTAKLRTAIDLACGDVLDTLNCTFDQQVGDIYRYILTIVFKDTSAIVEVPLELN